MGNELARRSRLRYDRAEMTQRVTRTLAAFDRNALAALRSRWDCLRTARYSSSGCRGPGTSLTEQILASHPQVHGAGELLYWIFAADTERAATPEQRAATIAELGRAYLRGARGTGARALLASSTSCPSTSGTSASFTRRCRAPGSFISSGMPLDTCLSIYFQGFSAAHPYATDFGDLAHYYHEYRRLMAHWRAVLPPGTLLEVRYEDLVDDLVCRSAKPLARRRMIAGRQSLASHSSFRCCTVSSARAASSLVAKGPSRSLPGVGPSSSSTLWVLRLYHHRFSSAMHIRLAKHGDSASSGSGFTHPTGSRGHHAAGIRGQKASQARRTGRQDTRGHRADAGGGSWSC